MEVEEILKSNPETIKKEINSKIKERKELTDAEVILLLIERILSLKERGSLW
ncbi:hypothetical protein KKC52_08485 [bacterium]|nr:hypothetical protein [bacterium]